MKINGIDVKLPRRYKAKSVVQVSGDRYCRWESAEGKGAGKVLHKTLRMAVVRASQFSDGCIRSVTHSSEGIVHHGQWRRI